MNPPINIDPEVLRRIIEQYQTQVPTGVEPQGFPSYTVLNNQTQMGSSEPRLTTQPQFDPNQIGFPQPQNLDELNELLRSGQIDQNQYEQLFTQMPEVNYNNSTELGVLADFQKYSEENAPKNNYEQLFGNMGAGVSTDSALFNIGRYAGMDSDVSGRNMGLVGSIGKVVMSGARNIASGIGYSKKNEYVKDYYQDKRKEVNYTPAPQYQNNNYTGGYSYGKYGGEFGGQGFQNGSKDKMNIFNGYNIGDPIEFEYGGKIEKGIIERIENGQIFLK